MIWRWPLRLMGGLAGAVLLYAVVAAAATFVPINKNFRQPTDGTEIFVSSNGIHMSLVVPVANPVADWRRHGIAVDPATAYLSFGWGERNFYLHTPTWADFRPGTGMRALLWQRTTLVHVDRMTGPPARSSVRLVLSDGQYRRLVQYIRASFAAGGIRRLAGAGYGPDDDFYEGTGTYSPFMTCNQWTNRALAVAGVRTALWSPLPWGVMYQARRAQESAGLPMSSGSR